MLQPTYVVSPEVNYDALDPQRRGFVCEVMLPEHSPVISVTGDIQSKKATAKCSAAFKACLKLYNKGYLSENLLPTTHKSLPAGTNALLALSEKKKGMYSMLIKPEFWKIGRGVAPTCLYLTLIDLDAGLDRPHQPMGLLTRNPLPQMPNFPIYLTDCRPSNVISQSSQTPLYVSAETIDILTGFTLRIYEDVYNKKYENDAKKMSYWVVPILPGKMSSPLSVTALDQILDMEQVHRVYNEPMWRWTPKTISKDLLDRYFVDPMNGGRRYYSNHLATQLKPQDPVPKRLPRSGHKFMDSILDYSDSKWAKSRDISRWNQSQPVLEVEKIPFRRNHLARVEEKEKGELDDLKTYICPEPLHVSNVSIQRFSMYTASY
jgi:endoribonuclease Dicer